MLSRVANSLYWLSRYLERAENLARLVNVNRYDALDVFSQTPEEADAIWKPLLYATFTEEKYAVAREEAKEDIDVAWFITFSEKSGESIRQCIALARENARMVRDQISEEIWLELNSFHLHIQSKEAENTWAYQPDVFYRQTIRSCMLLNGLVDATVSHDEGWNFIQTGKLLERADKTTRVLDMLAYDDKPERGKLASALRSCSAFSAFRADFQGDVTLNNVIAFLLFSHSFPRSVRYCIRHLDEYLHAISGSPTGSFTNEAERVNGSTLAQLNFSNINDVLKVGYHDYIDQLQTQFNEIGEGVFDTYIRLPQETETLPQATSMQWQWQQKQQQQ